jgi:hypothetical protein
MTDEHSRSTSGASPKIRPIAWWARAVTVTFAIWIGWNITAVPIKVWLIQTYSELAQSPDQAGTRLDDTIQLTILSRLPNIVLSLAMAIVFYRWMHRAWVNAALLGRRTHRSRAWLFWGWIAPPFFFSYGYRFITGMRASSTHPALETRRPSGALLSWWWALYIVYVLGSFVMPVVSGSWWTTLNDAEWATYKRNDLVADLVLLPVGIAAAVLAISVVRGISTLQEREIKSSSEP